jgi:hypothetical protein
MYEKALAQPGKCAQIKLRFFSKLHFLCCVRFDCQRDGGRAFCHTVHTTNMAERKIKDEIENKSRDTVSDNFVVGNLFF